MHYKNLTENILKKQSFLCVGLDSDIEKLPAHLPKTMEGVIEFNKKIIEATKDFCVSYKINTAFYESLGIKGWIAIEETLKFIPKDIFIIADAKRGDIGNTSSQYAKTFFETFPFDAVTVAPYMGKDSVKPFLDYANKATILLALTSNEGSYNFQRKEHEGVPLFISVMEQADSWKDIDNIMFVVGATHPKEFELIRDKFPNHFLLVPGVGAQGGSLQEVCKNGLNSKVGLLINSSRAIIFADSTENFYNQAGLEAKKIQTEMESILNLHFKA